MLLLPVVRTSVGLKRGQEYRITTYLQGVRLKNAHRKPTHLGFFAVNLNFLGLVSLGVDDVRSVGTLSSGVEDLSLAFGRSLAGISMLHL